MDIEKIVALKKKIFNLQDDLTHEVSEALAEVFKELTGRELSDRAKEELYSAIRFQL